MEKMAKPLSSMKNEITVVFFGFHARFGKI
jgi:hypothetical protein